MTLLSKVGTSSGDKIFPTKPVELPVQKELLVDSLKLNENPISASISKSSKISVDFFQDLQNKSQIERSDRLLEKAKKMSLSEKQVTALEKIVRSPGFNQMNTENIDIFTQQLFKKSAEECDSEPLTLSHCTQLVEAVKPYHVKECDPLSKPSLSKKVTLEAAYDEGETIPDYILQFDTTGKHTLNVKEYLDVRISRTIVKTMQDFQKHGDNIEFFIGSNEDMNAYYAIKGYFPEAQFGTDSSNKYYIFSSRDGSRKLVITGISNQSRLNNALLQLKFFGVDLNKVFIRGTFDRFIDSNRLELQKKLNKCHKGTKPGLAFIGTSWLVLKELYEYLYPGKLDTSLNIGEQQNMVYNALRKKTTHHCETHDINGVFEFSSVQVKKNGQPLTVVAFKMPNGSLSGIVTEELLKTGFKHICMVGAGGSLSKVLGGDLGALQIVEKSSYRDHELSLPKQLIMQCTNLQGIETRTRCGNITVDGPLEEDFAWLVKAEMAGHTSVDVETYHIFKALLQNKDESIRVLPGLFISDVVNEHPLQDKISAKNAYKNMPVLLKSIFKYENISQPDPIGEKIQAIQEKMKQKKFSPEIRSDLMEGRILTSRSLRLNYVQDIGKASEQIVLGFVGDSLNHRLSGMYNLTQSRRKVAQNFFQTVVRSEIELLMKRHKDNRSFEDVVTIFGFNRLFMRDIASVGTDIDFMLIVDTKDKKGLLADIRFFIKEIVKPKLNEIGIDIETADYLISDLANYQKGLDKTRDSLFTLANIDNILPIAGSNKIRDRMFSFTDAQLAEHFTNLLHNLSPTFDPATFKQGLIEKLNKQGEIFRKGLIQHLKKMANSELYIGKKPYNKKQTIQTIFANPEKLKVNIKKRIEKFPIKYCLNRIADLHFAAKIPFLKGGSFTAEKMNAIEQLALVLSNIVCRMNTAKVLHPALSLQEGYSEISLQQMAKMTPDDKKIVAELLGTIGVVIHPEKNDFAEYLYDSLWSLGKALCQEAQVLEARIGADAVEFSK